MAFIVEFGGQVRIIRRYTKAERSPYDGVAFRKLSCLRWGGGDLPLADARLGGPAFEAPEAWSQESSATFLRRCVFRGPVPETRDTEREPDVPGRLAPARAGKDGRTGEKEARQAIDRFAGAVAYWGWKGGYFDSDSDADAFFDEIRHILCHRLVAPELSLWAAVGAQWAYGAGSEDCRGMYAIDFRTGRTVAADGRFAAQPGDGSWTAAVFNLAAFHDSDSGADTRFDVAGFAHAIRLWTIALDISLHMAARRTRRQAEWDWSARALAIEPANMSGLLLVAGIAYDCDEGRALGAAVTALMSGAAHAASAEMAGALGAAPDFARSRTNRLDGIVERRRAAHALSAAGSISGVAAAARDTWDAALARAEQRGDRHAPVDAGRLPLPRLRRRRNRAGLRAGQIRRLQRRAPQADQ